MKFCTLGFRLGFWVEMVHAFRALDEFFILDSESGSVFQVDEAAYVAAVMLTGGSAPEEHDVTAEEVESAKQELLKLKDEGIMFSKGAATLMPPPSGVIKSMCLNICHDCNLRCKYCFADEGAYGGERSRMSIQTAKAAVDFLVANSGKRKNLEIDFFGGEPTLNFDVVKQTIDYARKEAAGRGKKFRFTITTNAVRLSDDVLTYINENMDNVVLSIDGREDVHNYARPNAAGAGSYAAAVKNSKRFAEIRGNKEYYVRGTFTALNTDFASDVLNLNDIGFGQLSVEPVVLPDGHPMAIGEEHLDAIYNEYEHLAREYLTRRRTDDKWFNFFHFMFDFTGGPCEKKRLAACGAGSEYVAVSPDGGVYPCHQFVGNKAYLMGNVLEGTEVDKDKSALLYGCNVLSKPECNECWAKYYCSGGCMANSANIVGDLYKPYEISCKIMKKRTECAIAVNALEKSN